MTRQATLDKLKEMRLSAMADGFMIQLGDPKMEGIPFEDRFGMLVDIEYSNRKSNRLKRLVHQAAFDQPEAHFADIDYTSGRKLNRALLQRLANCEYVMEHNNLFITGATGSGKTYLACALGMEACKRYYKVQYLRLPDFLTEMELSRQTGSCKKVLAKYSKSTLLILGEWLLLKPTNSEQQDIFELLHSRQRNTSTIFCSQYHPNGWYMQLGGESSPLADAILDRIMHNSYRVHIESTNPDRDVSMREVYGLDKSLRE